MKVFDKIYDFLIDYDDLLKFGLFLFILLIFIFSVANFFDKRLTEEKHIIENTKDFVIFDKCRLIDGKYYCYNLGE